MTKSLIAVLLASLFIGMGCSGAGGSPGSPVVGGPGPDGGSNPFFTPSGEGDVDVSDDGEAAPAAPAAKPPANPPPGKPKAPSIECFDKVFPEGSVGTPYAHTLEATGGTPPFQYALKNGAGLPEGLVLSADGAISGTPAEAGNFKPKVVVTDGGEKKKECKTQITVKGDLGINVAAAEGQGRWDAVYAITVSDSVGDITWIWDGDLDNVCMSSTAPDVLTPDFRDECTAGSKIASGTTAFLWLKADRQGAEPLSLTLTVTSEYAKDQTSYDFEFEYTPSPACGNNIKEGNEACDGTDVEEGYTCHADCTKSPFAVSIQVETWTGDAGDNSDTDSTISIKFCKDKGMSDCTSFFTLNDRNDDDAYENRDWNVAFLHPANMTDEYQYFQIKHNGGGDDSPSWLLQGIRVTIVYADDAFADAGEVDPRDWMSQAARATISAADAASLHRYVYFNPCIEKWMDAGDTLPFGPNDTAVCAIVETGGARDYAGTDDNVLLVFENFVDGVDDAEIDDGLVSTSISAWSPHFIGWGPNNEEYRLELGWNCSSLPNKSTGDCDDIDEFEEGSKHSFGDYLFDVKPYRKKPAFHFEKDPDGADGGWYLEAYEVFVFHPARTLSGEGQTPDSTVYYKEIPYRKWLGGGEGELFTDSDTLEEAGWSKITPAIGGYWGD